MDQISVLMASVIENPVSGHKTGIFVDLQGWARASGRSVFLCTRGRGVFPGNPEICVGVLKEEYDRRCTERW